jgi:hypothetical protein
MGHSDIDMEYQQKKMEIYEKVLNNYRRDFPGSGNHSTKP